MDSNTPQDTPQSNADVTPDIRLLWFRPGGGEPGLATLHQFINELARLETDGYRVVARTSTGNGVLYELRRGDAE